jgi:cytochrome c553
VIAERKISLEGFSAWGVAELEDAIVRSVDARREQRRFKHRLEPVAAGLDPDALASLARVLQRQRLGSVGDLGKAAVLAWARRVGIELGA